MLIKFVCKGCGKRRRMLFDSAGDVKAPSCSCGQVLVRDADPPSSSMMETLDNGVMPRALERFQNAEELHKDHAASDPRYKRV